MIVAVHNGIHIGVRSCHAKILKHIERSVYLGLVRDCARRQVGAEKILSGGTGLRRGGVGDKRERGVTASVR